MQHYIDLGIVEPTIVYEIELKKIAVIPAMTSLAEITDKLKMNGITNVLVDPAQPQALDMMRERGLIAQRVILKTPKGDK